jgi:hypothetical protein
MGWVFLKNPGFLQPCLHQLADHPVGGGAEQHLRVPATVLHPPHLAHLIRTHK